MEIVERRENALLKRVEIEFIIRHENQPTPTRKAMTESLHKLEPGSKKELVVIKDHNKLSALNPAAEESSEDEGGESSE